MSRAAGVLLLAVLAAQPVRAEQAAAAGARDASKGGQGHMEIKRSGTQPSQTGPAEHFTGDVRIDPLFQAHDPARASGAYVTFEACARSAWHTHPLGQLLIVTAGVGRVQQWGGAVEEIRTGDVVWTPPGVKHWHGAAPTTAMTHLAVQEASNGKVVDWMEKVTDEQYGVAPANPATGAPSRTQADDVGAVAPALARYDSLVSGDRLLARDQRRHRDEAAEAQRASRVEQDFGVVAPGVVQYTTDVLFRDLWLRPGLAPRDRSLVTVSALVASGQVAQITYHLNRAMNAGLTKVQAAEALTQLAFHAGWPNVFSAMPVVKAVFESRAQHGKGEGS